MKNTVLRIAWITGALYGFGYASGQERGQGTQPPPGPPTIGTQPVNQTVDYGANTGFRVVASGSGLRYEWRKDGLALADYGNVSGAKTPKLELVGVAQIDVATYTVVITSAGGSITSSPAKLQINSTTIFSDDFETGALRKWNSFSDNSALALSTLQNRTPGGSRSALMNNSQAKIYHNLGIELAGRVKSTFWMYDHGGSQDRSYGELRGYTGPGHGRYASPGGLRQLFAIGRYTVQFGTNQTGTLAGEKVNPQKYQGKVERGKNIGWFNLDGGPDRSKGWHQFAIERDADGTTVRFYVDGVLGRTITDADHVLLDCVTLGSIGAGSGVGNSWFDDLRVEAFPWRFDWQRKDSEGKGLPDWVRLRETGTDTTVTDIRQITTVSEAAGHAASRRSGHWESDGSGIYCASMRGYLEYVLNAPVDDAYRIEIEGRERSGKSPSVTLPLILSIDGEYLGRFQLPYDGATNGAVHCFTPFLKAGTHTIRVFWDNVQSGCSLYVRAARLQALSGPDLNGNGIKDWVENRLLAQSGIEFIPAASATSPVCIEGRGQYLSMMQCRAGPSAAQMAAVAVQPGAGHRWYANVALSPDRPTRIELSHQNDGLRESADLVWEVTNLLKADPLTIRKGDALLLTAVPAIDSPGGGSVEIAVEGVAAYSTDSLTPVVHRFEQTGTFRVSGTFIPSGESRSIEVKVVGAVLDGPLAAWAARRRYWNCTNLPPQVALDVDPRLRVAQFPLPPDRGPNARQIGLTNDVAEARYVLARLGKNGAVLNSTVVQGFRLFNCYDTYLRLIETYPDQSQLIEEAFVLSPVLPEVSVVIQIIVGGVTFEDGTVTKTLTAADFDELGICHVRYIRAPNVKTSVCHTTKAYQGDTLIGWPVYEK